MMTLAVPYPITDTERAAVTRLVNRQPDADLILELLFGELSAASNTIQRAQMPVTPGERERIRWMRSKGMTVGDIATEINRSRQTVSVIVKEQEK